MGRWEPDARGRLAEAAMQLYAERGFDQTSVADIADRAGVTERTFFRHFADKREVLFDGTSAFQTELLAGIASAPADAPPLAAAIAGIHAVAAFIEGRGREFSTRRARIIASNASLRERELLKLTSAGTAASDVLRERGAAPADARLAADSAVTIFRVAFERWTGSTRGPRLGTCIEQAYRQFRALACGPGE